MGTKTLLLVPYLYGRHQPEQDNVGRLGPVTIPGSLVRADASLVGAVAGVLEIRGQRFGCPREKRIQNSSCGPYAGMGEQEHADKIYTHLVTISASVAESSILASLVDRTAESNVCQQTILKENRQNQV